MNIDKESVDAATLTAPALRQGLQHWQRLRPSGAAMPPVSAHSLVDWPDVALSALSVVSGRPARDRLRLEFLGSLVSMFGGNARSGLYLDEFYPPAYRQIADSYFAEAAALSGPMLALDRIGPAENVIWVEVWRLTLPFADEAGDACLFANCQDYRPTPAGRQSRMQLAREGLVLASRAHWRVTGV